MAEAPGRAAEKRAAEARSVVEDAYRRRVQGDLEGLRAVVDAGLRWCCHAPPDAFPFAGVRQGFEAVLEYFGELERSWELLRYDVEEILADGDRVVALCEVRFRCRASGRCFQGRKVDVFRVEAGRISSFEEFFDSAALQAATG